MIKLALEDAVRNLALKRKELFWDVDSIGNLSEQAVVERIFNYGGWEDVQELISILGREKVAEIFFDRIGRRRNNFSPRIKRFFELYFKEDYA